MTALGTFVATYFVQPFAQPNQLPYGCVCSENTLRSQTVGALVAIQGIVICTWWPRGRGISITSKEASDNWFFFGCQGIYGQMELFGKASKVFLALFRCRPMHSYDCD